MTPWFAIRRTDALAQPSPLAVELCGRRYVLFRGGNGRPALLDGFCSHRRAPLALGKLKEGCVACPYHGWRFDRSGACVEAPGDTGVDERRQRGIDSFAVAEQQGLIWASPFVLQSQNQAAPPRFPLPSPRTHRVSGVSWTFDADFAWVLENMSDFSHVPFAHGESVGRGRTPVMPRMTLTESESPQGAPLVRARYELSNDGFVGGELLGLAGRGRSFPIYVDTTYEWPGRISTTLQLEGGHSYMMNFFVHPVDPGRTRVEFISARTFLLAAPFDWLEHKLLHRIFGEDAALARESDWANIDTRRSTAADSLGIRLRRLLELHPIKTPAACVGGHAPMARDGARATAARRAGVH